MPQLLNAALHIEHVTGNIMDNPRPASIKEWFEPISKWLMPIFLIEWIAEWLLYYLRKWAWVEITGILVLFVGIGNYLYEIPERKDNSIRQAHLIVGAQSGGFDEGSVKRKALEYMVSEKISVVGINLKNASLVGGQLHGAKFRGVEFNRANFNDADLKDASFHGAKLTLASFRGANLPDAKFDMGHLFGSDFDSANLRGADFKSTKLEKVKLLRADLRGADFSGAILEVVSFYHADLRGADFTYAKLESVDFFEADLEGADFSNATVGNVSFAAHLVDIGMGDQLPSVTCSKIVEAKNWRSAKGDIIIQCKAELVELAERQRN
jgi:hypothetical protein